MRDVIFLFGNILFFVLFIVVFTLIADWRERR
jgi:hypothetical protein